MNKCQKNSHSKAMTDTHTHTHNHQYFLHLNNKKSESGEDVRAGWGWGSDYDGLGGTRDWGKVVSVKQVDRTGQVKVEQSNARQVKAGKGLVKPKDEGKSKTRAIYGTERARGIELHPFHC